MPVRYIGDKEAENEKIKDMLRRCASSENKKMLCLIFTRARHAVAPGAPPARRRQRRMLLCARARARKKVPAADARARARHAKQMLMKVPFAWLFSCDALYLYYYIMMMSRTMPPRRKRRARRARARACCAIRHTQRHHAVVLLLYHVAFFIHHITFTSRRIFRLFAFPAFFLLRHAATFFSFFSSFPLLFHARLAVLFFSFFLIVLFICLAHAVIVSFLLESGRLVEKKQ